MKNISNLRKSIDDIDQSIVALLNKRLALAKDVAAFKVANNLPIVNRKREEEVIDIVTQLAATSSLKKSIPEIYRIIIDTMITEEKSYHNGENHSAA